MTLRRLAGFGPALVLTLALLALWELFVRDLYANLALMEISEVRAILE